MKAIAGLAGVLIPAVIGLGIHFYNKGQRELENLRHDNEFRLEELRHSNEFRLRQLDSARQFLPQLLSKDTDEKWRTLTLISSVGGEGLARAIARCLLKGYWRQENRELIERLMKDEDPDIAELAAETFRSMSSPPAEAGQAPDSAVETDYELRTSDVITHSRQVRFEDAAEQHGRWVVSRGRHTLVMPARFRMGIYLVTNEFFLDFVRDGGYSVESYWAGTVPGAREKSLSQDGRTFGPATWPSEMACLPGRERHPVAGIGYHEAMAFCNWLQQKHPPGEPGWKWCLPTEDMWEFSARTEEGFLYPWGHEFGIGRCNSVETGSGTTTDVSGYPAGRSRCGCFDMAGNVWEFVVADDQEHWSCVLKGGSFRNSQHQVKSCLRLFGVPREHRPPDFGFRVSQMHRPGTA